AHKDQRGSAAKIVRNRIAAVDREQTIIDAMALQHPGQITRALTVNMAKNPNRLHNVGRFSLGDQVQIKMLSGISRLVMVFFMIAATPLPAAFAATEAEDGKRENNIVIEVAGILGSKV